jgi:hypothetical protein
MCAGSDMPPERSSDGRRSGLIARLCEDPAAMGTNDARHALLARLIDHAPTFPPASLSPDEALAEDARAAASPHSFMLGRLVWPASRLRELAPAERGVSAVLDAPLRDDARIQAVEVPPGFDLAAAPARGEVYVEVPLDDDLESHLEAIEKRGFRAKVRCTGAPADLGRFMLECRARGITYKATAGLHHAIRSEDEYGFLNLLAAAVFADEGALHEDDPKRFELRPDGFRWGSQVAGHVEIAEARTRRLHSIGSCSFFEPVEELEALGMLPL